MKLKYYLRGMGIGIILTAIVMGFALGGRGASLSDSEIIERARALGMTESESGVLANSQTETTEGDSDDQITSGETLPEEGTQISEEEQQEISGSDTNVSEVAKEEKDGEEDAAESGSTSESDKASEGDEKEGGKGSLSASSGSSKADDAEECATLAGNQASEEEPETASSDAASSDASSSNTSAAITASSSSSAKVAVSGKTVTIPGGMSSDQVAAVLEREGFVDNAVTFNRYLIDRGMDRYIHSGVKTIPEGADYETIANIITKG